MWPPIPVPVNIFLPIHKKKKVRYAPIIFALRGARTQPFPIREIFKRAVAFETTRRTDPETYHIIANQKDVVLSAETDTGTICPVGSRTKELEKVRADRVEARVAADFEHAEKQKP